MSAKEKIESYLKDNNVAYGVRRHAPAFTAQQVAESEHVSGRLVVKVVIVKANGDDLRMVALPAPLNVNLSKAAALMGVPEVRLAHEDEFAARFPGCEVGAMPPLGNLYGMPVYVDRSLTEDETIIFQAGTHEHAIQMKYADFERLVQPLAGDLAN
jgi:Ala-tRNA(Pro) deacylase